MSTRLVYGREPILGGALAVWFIILNFRALATGLRSSDPFLRGLTLGGAAGIFGILVHSLFDFNLQIPSNALMFMVLAAVVSTVGAGVSSGNQIREGLTPQRASAAAGRFAK